MCRLVQKIVKNCNSEFSALSIPLSFSLSLSLSASLTLSLSLSQTISLTLILSHSFSQPPLTHSQTLSQTQSLSPSLPDNITISLSLSLSQFPWPLPRSLRSPTLSHIFHQGSLPVPECAENKMNRFYFLTFFLCGEKIKK
jgi:hypothetical protein